MDITLLNPASGGTPSYKSQSAQNTDTSSVGTLFTPQQSQQNQAPSLQSTTDVQTQYEEVLKSAALSFKDSYPLGDQEFSIFKDASGQYITRYVSLRDGSITYVPEPVLVRALNSGINPAKISVKV